MLGDARVIASAIMLIIGIVLVMFLPGYLISLIIFRELEFTERIFIGFGLSISVVVALGFFLSFLGYALGIKAITPTSTTISLTMICLILLGIYLLGPGRARDNIRDKLIAR